MRHLPEDDEPLVNFLRQYAPKPPAASPDLEEKILNALTSLPESPHRLVLPLWLLRGAAVAACLLATWMGYRFFTPQITSAELVSLEAFMETNWNGVIDDSSDWFFSTQSSFESE